MDALKSAIRLSLQQVLAWALVFGAPVIGAQNQNTRPSSSKAATGAAAKANPVDRAIRAICDSRLGDPQATVPIDEMAMSRPLPFTDARVIAGNSRAMTLLPAAKRLVPFAVRRVAMLNGVEPLNLKWIITRVQAVRNVREAIEERDNSSWRPGTPDTIFFGTLFLAGLHSDEAVIAVLGHELTHAINGTDEGLEPVVTRLQSKASRLGRPLTADQALELVCEMVGIEVLRDHIAQTKGQRKGSRQRLARALQKDCVRRDLSDENHLSPRETMGMLLRLNPSLASALAAEAPAKEAQTKTRKRIKAGRRR